MLWSIYPLLYVSPLRGIKYRNLLFYNNITPMGFLLLCLFLFYQYFMPTALYFLAIVINSHLSPLISVNYFFTKFFTWLISINDAPSQGPKLPPIISTISSGLSLPRSAIIEIESVRKLSLVV